MPRPAAHLAHADRDLVLLYHALALAGHDVMREVVLVQSPVLAIEVVYLEVERVHREVAAHTLLDCTHAVEAAQPEDRRRKLAQQVAYPRANVDSIHV